MKVYATFPSIIVVIGKAPIRVSWIDTSKQDEFNPKHRRKLVAKDFKRGADPDLYTAMPPIDMLRCLASFPTTGWSRAGRKRMHAVARAYLNAPSFTPTFVDTCGEDGTRRR